jgi:hypothetical protein
VKTGARVDLLNRLVTDRLAIVLVLDGDALERREMTPLSPA